MTSGAGPARSGRPPRDTTASTELGRSAAATSAAAAPVLAPNKPPSGGRPIAHPAMVATTRRQRGGVSKRCWGVTRSTPSSAGSGGRRAAFPGENPAGTDCVTLANNHALDFGQWRCSTRSSTCGRPASPGSVPAGTAAREQLRAALEIFERLGAVPWADQASVELAATGETARRRDASTLHELTPQELQIARLPAAGKTTREVAAALFLSPETVAHITFGTSIASRASIRVTSRPGCSGLGDANADGIPVRATPLLYEVAQVVDEPPPEARKRVRLRGSASGERVLDPAPVVHFAEGEKGICSGDDDELVLDPGNAGS
jgi:hypothetical protein